MPMPQSHDTFRAAEVALDAARMRRVAAGDRGAFTEIIRAHQDRVWAVAYRFTQRRDDADDISQEAFIRLWNAASRWEPAARLSTWLYRVVTNLCLDFRRKQAHAPMALTADMAEPAAAEAAPLEAQENIARVQRAVAALPERQRMAVILHRFEDLSYHEIARSTGWGEAAIESLLSRAYATLRQQLVDLQSLT
jgi:RNA polymerase sigma-70 factor, ECF subfamily